MILHKSMNASFLSNSYLVADKRNGHGVIIDTGGPPEPLLAKIESEGLRMTHILCTHHHHDHVMHNELYRTKLGCEVWVPHGESDHFSRFDRTIQDYDQIHSGGLVIRALPTPGHTLGQMAFALEGHSVFSGDTLFRETIGGTRAPGHSTLEDLKDSIMEIFMKLPMAMSIYPGHTDSTTVEHEWEKNPFIRFWRGLEEEDGRACRVFGRSATLLVLARDYDGGSKCLVRFSDGGEDVTPGSRTEIIG